MNTRLLKIHINGWYLLVNINFAPICVSDDDRHHNTNASRSHDITDQQWWRHNAKSEKTVLSNNGKMICQWLVLVDWCIQGKNSV